MKITCVLLWLLILSVNSAAQYAEDARSIVNKLASEAFAGRGFVDDGVQLAGAYISDQFVAAGLKSFGKDYYQTFKIQVNTFPSTLKVVIDTSKLIPGVDFLVDPSSGSIYGDYPVYMVKKQDLLIDARFNETVRLCWGKFLVIDERGFTLVNSAERKRADEILRLFQYSSTIKNAGTIILTSDKLTWSISGVQMPKPCLMIKGDFGFRHNTMVHANIEAKLVTAKTDNVIGYVEGSEKPDSFLVVLAHYDHLGKMGDNVFFPGANDNASGVAMLLSLVKYFTAHPAKYSMVFMALSGEEAGVLGARYYVEHPLFDLGKIIFLVNFDLAGTGNEGIKVVNGSVYPRQFNKLKEINQEKQYLSSVQIRGTACNSDHCLFYEKGVPCFYIYTLGGSAAYHDIQDTADNLTLIEFADYFRLMTDFFNSFH
jgi:aminopeptidase YwaD